MSVQERKHIIVKIKGQCQKKPNDAMLAKIAGFHRMCVNLDPDWPYVAPARVGGVAMDAGDPRTRRYVCSKCHGIEYVSPFLTASQVKALGKRAGLKVKVVRWEASESCGSAITEEIADGKSGWRVVGGGESATPLLDRIASEVATGRSTSGTRTCKNCHREIMEHTSKSFWVHVTSAIAMGGRYYCGEAYGNDVHADPADPPGIPIVMAPTRRPETVDEAKLVAAAIAAGVTIDGDQGGWDD
jgi:hypothetical protein